MCGRVLVRALLISDIPARRDIPIFVQAKTRELGSSVQAVVVRATRQTATCFGRRHRRHLQTKTSGPRGPDDACRSCYCGLVFEMRSSARLTVRSVAGRTGSRIAVRAESLRRRGGAGWRLLAWRRVRFHRGRRRHRFGLSGLDHVRLWPTR